LHIVSFSRSRAASRPAGDKVCQKKIYARDVSGIGVDYQNADRDGFKPSAVPGLGCRLTFIRGIKPASIGYSFA
jgi:hypothetical protein